jgi:CrcB protein
MLPLLYLAVGGVVGTLARYGLGRWIPAWAGTEFPWGTLVVNAAGSLLLGFTYRAAELIAIPAELRGLVTVGFCGAFTTFSTLSYKTVRLLQEGLFLRGVIYAFGSVAVGLMAVYFGMAMATTAFHGGG